MTNIIITNNYILPNDDNKIKDNPYYKLFNSIVRNINTSDTGDDEDIRIPNISINDTKSKSYFEEVCVRGSFHRPSPSMGQEDMTQKFKRLTTLDLLTQNVLKTSAAKTESNKRIIKCDNNIENYYFNNINITTNDINKIPLITPDRLNLDTSFNKSRPIDTEYMSVKDNKKLIFGQKSKFKIEDILKTDVRKSIKKTPKSGKIDFLQDLNGNITLTPLKKISDGNFNLDKSPYSVYSNSNIKNVESLPKLMGDDEIDMFSEEDENR
jgi:hypothetical protein